MSAGPTDLRILIVTANYFPSVGGIEQYSASLGRELARRGHEVTILCCRAAGAPLIETSAGVRIVRIPASDALHRRLGVPYPLPSPRELARGLRRLLPRADVVNVHDAVYATSFATLLLAKRSGIPSVLTQHVGFVPQSRRSLDVAQHVALATLGRSARLATRVVSYNPAVAEWARARWRLPHVTVIPPGVIEAPSVDRVAVRRELGLPADRFIALFVGRDVPKKGLDIFLDAGDSRYELVAVTDREGSHQARTLPLMSSESLRELLGTVDAFVLPSEGEGLPLTLQEALVTGLACVVSPGPGYRHFLRDDEVLFVPREAAAVRRALVRLAGDPLFRDELGRRGRAAGVREFGLERFVDGYEELFRELAAGRRRAG